MRGYCVGRPVALSVPKFSFAWNSFPVISFWRLICSSHLQNPHLFWDEGKFEAGVSEVLLPEPPLAQVDNFWVVLYVVVKCPGTKIVGPWLRRSSHTWQLPQKWRRREWVQSLQKWAPGQSCWRTSSPHWECFLFGSSLCMFVSRGVDLAIVSMSSLMTDTLSNWTPRFLKPPARKWVFVSWTWHYIFGLR